MDNLLEKFEKAKVFKREKGYEKFFLEISKQHPICVFGGGALGKHVCTWLLENGIRPKCFCDNNQALHGKELAAGIPCISFRELLALKDELYVIVGIGDKEANEAVNIQLKEFYHIFRNPLGLTAYLEQTFDLDADEFGEGVQYVLSKVADRESKELFEVLTNLRLQDHVIDYPHILEKFYRPNQYIVNDIIDYRKIRSYVDCGAYTGDSLEQFINLGTDAEYYCFEMDRAIFDILSRNAAQYAGKKIHLFPYGIGETEAKVSYVSDCTGGSKMSASGTEWAKIIPLDSIDFEGKVDFIKMDIEGAEEGALNGAKDLIAKDHPVLAISIYHNFSQFVNVVRIIKKIESRYKIYIRQHKYTLDDTVCYAVYE